MTRTTIYVDGGPFQDGVRGLGLSMEMDVAGFLRSISGDVQVDRICYVVAECPAHPYPIRHRNEQAQLAAFEASGIEVYRCPTQIIGSIFVEREVESRLTALMASDAFQGRCDRALIISRRASLLPALAAVKDAGRSLHGAFFDFHNQPPNPLAAACDSYSSWPRDALVPFWRE